MSLKLRSMIAALCCLLSFSAVAEIKIAVVDARRALFESESAKSFQKKMEKDLGGDLANVKKREKDLRALQQKLKKDAAIMGDEEKRRAQSEFEEKQAEFKFHASKLQKRQQDMEQGFIRKNAPRLDKILQDIIDKEKFDLVLQKQPAPMGAVVYAADKVDITKRLLDKLNASK